MSKFLNNPTVGIDVSADFSVVAILSPNGELYRKPFKVIHNKMGFDYLVEQIKKVEKEFSMKTAIFMESTGVYHLTLFHFLKSKFETYIFNPLITNSNKNSGIRKVKNDKKDAISIAKIGKYQNIKCSSAFDVQVYTVKSLCRDYYKLTDTKATYKKKLSTDLKVIFPGYSDLFANITGKTSLAILKQYTSPQAIIDADKNAIIELVTKLSRKGLLYSEKIYDKLLSVANEAIYLGIQTIGLYLKLTNTITLIETLEMQQNILLKEINSYINSGNLPDVFIKNIELLCTIPGVGKLSAITIISEIGDIDGFIKPKHLVAFFGLDPSVNQSGKFNSDQNKMSKRGSKIARRALYAVALASIRRNRNGVSINEVLLTYYKENMKSKKKKVAIVAIMNKLVRYMFSVLKNQKNYEVRNPKLHEKMYLQNHLKSAA